MAPLPCLGTGTDYRPIVPRHGLPCGPQGSLLNRRPSAKRTAHSDRGDCRVQMPISPLDRVCQGDEHLPRWRNRERRTAAKIENARLGYLVVVSPLIAREARMKQVKVEFQPAVRVHLLPCSQKREPPSQEVTELEFEVAAIRGNAQNAFDKCVRILGL